MRKRICIYIFRRKKPVTVKTSANCIAQEISQFLCQQFPERLRVWIIIISNVKKLILDKSTLDNIETYTHTD